MGKKKKKEPSKKGQKVGTAPIKYNMPENITTRFVTNSTVQIMEEEFKICFFEAKPIMRLDLNTPPATEVQADCVASVVMTPNRVAGLVDVLQQQLIKYDSRQEEMKKQLPKLS